MKLFLQKIVVSLLVFALCYITFLVLWGVLMPSYLNKNLKYKLGLSGFMHTRLKQADSIQNIDILFLGSSHTYRGFDNRIFAKKGFSTFNFGSSNQTPIQTNILLQTYLHQFQPKLVIYEVFPENFEMDGLESGVDIISNSNNVSLRFQNAIQLKHITAFNTLIFATFSQLFFQKHLFLEKTTNELDSYINGGFVQTNLLKNVSLSEKQHPKLHWMFKEEQWQAFQKSIHLLKANKIPFVLVQAPVTKPFYNNYLNNQEVNLRFKEVANFYNFNDEYALNLSDTNDFYDAHHLTQIGVNKFNDSLLHLLNENGVLKFKNYE